jgi:Neutral/alkaline non-lysosomal ceramidase, N-terminal
MNSEVKPLRAGVGRRCANPPPNIAHGGWGAQKHEQAEGIDMDLWATALAFSDSISTALILDIDIQILANERADQIRSGVSQATGLPLENIRASATHTHSGPVPYKSWIEKGYEMVGPWFEQLARWCAEAAIEAISNLQPVTVRAGRGSCRINSNRRSVTASGERFLGVNSDGPCDHEVIVIKLDNAARQSVATLVNFACHPTIMGPPNRLITPDYPGAMKRVVEQAVGGLCIFFQGASGDQGPVIGFQGDVAVYRNFGAILGHEAARVALELDHLPASVKFENIIPSGAPLGMYAAEFTEQPSLPLRVLQKEIAVPLRDGLPERKTAAANLDFWKNRLKLAREKSDDARITEAVYMARRADIQLRMAEDFGGATTANVRTHFTVFGDVALVGCNIEPFCEIGLNIKHQSSFPFTCVSGYTNGRMAYMATAEEWPKGGYEVENSPFGRNAADVFEKEIIATLHDLRRNPKL